MPTTTAQDDLDLDTLLVQPEVQQALVTLLRELPSIATAATVLSKACQVGREVLTDGDLLGALEDKVRDAVGSRTNHLTGAVREARRRAEQDTTPIGVFGLLRLLKEPTVQKNLRFVQALCNVMTENDSPQRRDS